MKKYVQFFLIITTISSPFFSKAALEASKLQVLKKYKTKTPLLVRQSYQLNVDWDALIEITLFGTEDQARDALHIIFSAQVKPGREAGLFIMDLYKIFHKNPVRLINHGLSFYNNNKECLHYWLIPDTQFIEFSEFKNALQNYKTTNKSEQQKLDQFLSTGKSYFKKLKVEGISKSLDKCNLTTLQFSGRG